MISIGKLKKVEYVGVSDCCEQGRTKVDSEMDEGDCEAVAVVTKQERELFDPSPQITLPLKFLYNLYKRGYDIIWLKYEQKDFFTVLATQLNLVGVFMDSGEELKQKLVRYQRKNIDTLVESPFSQGLGFTSIDERDRRELYVKRVDDLESNDRYFEAIDLHCIANMFGIEICVFCPDYSIPTMLGTFKYKCEKGTSRKEIAIVVDASKYPTWVYRTTMVTVTKIGDNPYDVKKVGDGAEEVKGGVDI